MFWKILPHFSFVVGLFPFVIGWFAFVSREACFVFAARDFFVSQ